MEESLRDAAASEHNEAGINRQLRTALLHNGNIATMSHGEGGL